MTRPKHTWTKEETRVLLEMWFEPIPAVAERLGMARTQVHNRRNFLREKFADEFILPLQQRRFTPEEIAILIDRLEDRSLSAEVAEIVEADYQTVANLRNNVRRAGSWSERIWWTPCAICEQPVMLKNAPASINTYTHEWCRDEVVVDMYRGGSPIAEISRETGLTHPVIYDSLHRNGVELRMRRWTPDEDVLFESMTIDQIAHITGRSLGSVKARRRVLANAWRVQTRRANAPLDIAAEFGRELSDT